MAKSALNLNNEGPCVKQSTYVLSATCMHPKLPLTTSVRCRGLNGESQHPRSHFGSFKRITKTPHDWSMSEPTLMGLLEMRYIINRFHQPYFSASTTGFDITLFIVRKYIYVYSYISIVR